jgi:hypothetical protein
MDQYPTNPQAYRLHGRQRAIEGEFVFAARTSASRAEGRTVPGRPGPSAEPRPRLHDQAVDARLGEPPARRDSGRAPADDRHFPIAVGQTPFRDGRIRSLLRSLHEASATAKLSQQRVLPRFHGLSQSPLRIFRTEQRPSCRILNCKNYNRFIVALRCNRSFGPLGFIVFIGRRQRPV